MLCIALLLWVVVQARLALTLDHASTYGRAIANNRTQGLITMNGMWYILSNSTTDTASMDSLTDAEACTRDAALMSRMGINTIYTDSLDPSANHDDCFSIFNSVGIYVVVVFQNSTFRPNDEADVDKGYTTERLEKMFEWIDAVKDYDNLLAFDIGLFQSPEWVPASRFAKAQKIFRAFIRDVKDYISHNSARQILVGVSLTNPPFWSYYYMTDFVEYLSCVDTAGGSNSSGADFIGFVDIKYYTKDPLQRQLEAFTEFARQMENATIPTLFTSYASMAENGEYNVGVFNETLKETELLYNRSNEIIMPYGPLSGGARWEWTNVRISDTISTNPGLTVLDRDGNLRLTENYDVLNDIFAGFNTGSWLSGESAVTFEEDPHECAKDLIVNATLTFTSSSTLALATDWELPTRPPGLDDIITSGVQGTRGQMVDVIVTTIRHDVRDSKGDIITDLVLKPTKSEARSTTARADPTSSGSTSESSSSLSTGAKAGIGVGVSLAGVVALAGLGFFLLRRRRRAHKFAPVEVETKNSPADSDGPDEYKKAELAAGPDVEANVAELPPADMATPKEVIGDGYPGISAQIGREPAELPASERAQELPGTQSLR